LVVALPAEAPPPKNETSPISSVIGVYYHRRSLSLSPFLGTSQSDWKKKTAFISSWF
jgi:hypothetical protein